MTYKEWIEELQGFLTREDRLYDEFSLYLNAKSYTRLKEWLEAAFNAGKESTVESACNFDDSVL